MTSFNFLTPYKIQKMPKMIKFKLNFNNINKTLNEPSFFKLCNNK